MLKSDKDLVLSSFEPLSFNLKTATSLAQSILEEQKRFDSIEPWNPMEETNKHLAEQKEIGIAQYGELKEANRKLAQQLESADLQLRELCKVNSGLLVQIDELREVLNKQGEQICVSDKAARSSTILSIVAIAVAFASLVSNFIWP